MIERLPQNLTRVLWREWRNTPDGALASQIYEVVKNTPIGWPFLAFCFALGFLYFGPVFGLTSHILGQNAGSLANPRSWTTNPQTSTLAIIQGAITGGILATLIGSILRRHITWENWLSWWAPAHDLGMLMPLVLVSAMIRGLLVIALFRLCSVLMAPRTGGLITAYACIHGTCLLIAGILAINDERGFRRLTRLMFAVLMLFGIFAQQLAPLQGIVLVIVGSLGGILIRLGGMPITNLLLRALVGLAMGTIILALNPFHNPPGSIIWEYSGLVATGALVCTLLSFESTPLDGLFITESQYPADPLAARPYCIWWRKRPPLQELEHTLRYLNSAPWSNLLNRTDQQRRNPPPVEVLVHGLQKYSWSERFVAKLTLFALGTETLPHLEPLVRAQDSDLAKEARWLIQQICEASMSRAKDRNVQAICPSCYTRFRKLYIDLPGPGGATYFACPICKQNRNSILWDGEIIAALDHSMDREYTILGRAMYVNWLRVNRLFEFDSVEIVNATEPEIEKFVIQVRNDPNPGRRQLYKSMTCRVSSQITMSKELFNLLANVFGNVIVVQQTLCLPGSKTS